MREHTHRHIYTGDLASGHTASSLSLSRARARARARSLCLRRLLSLIPHALREVEHEGDGAHRAKKRQNVHPRRDVGKGAVYVCASGRVYTLHACTRARAHTQTIIHNNRVHTHAHAHSRAQSSARHAFVYLCMLYMYVHKHTVASVRHLYTQPPGLLALKHHAVMHHEAGLAIGHGVLSRLAARVHAL